MAMLIYAAVGRFYCLLLTKILVPFLPELVAYLQHHRAVDSRALVRSFDAAQVKVCPVNEILVLSQTERVGQLVYNDLPLKTCSAHDNKHL